VYSAAGVLGGWAAGEARGVGQGSCCLRRTGPWGGRCKSTLAVVLRKEPGLWNVDFCSCTALYRLSCAACSSLHLGILMENMRREGYEFEVRGQALCQLCIISASFYCPVVSASQPSTSAPTAMLIHPSLLRPRCLPLLPSSCYLLLHIAPPCR
jgi:hypothetical protein